MENDFIISQTSDGEKFLEKYSGSDSTVELPSGIAFIGEDAFLENQEIEKIIIPEGVDAIESYAFSGCKNLKSVVLPESLQEINLSAFSECEKLSQINFSKKLRIVGPKAFSGCKNLKIELLPDFLIEVCDDSFDDTVSALSKNDAYKISDGIMYNENAKSLLFAADKNLGAVKIKNGTKYLGWNSLSNLKNLKSVSVPASVVYVGRGAFMFSEKLEKIIFPKSVRSVDSGSFFNCVNLREVIFQGNGLKKICGDSFAGCEKLKTVTVPAECEIDETAFENFCNVKVRENQCAARMRR